MPSSPEQILAELTPVQRGQDVAEVASSSRINALQDAIRHIFSDQFIKTGMGLLKGHTTGQTTIRSRGGGRGRGGGGYTVWNYSTESEKGRHSITFTDGLVNNILPKNVGEKVLLKTGKNFIFALGKASGGMIEQVAIISDTERRARLVEAKNAPPTEVPVLIALAVVEDNAIAVTRLRFRNVVCTPLETRRASKKPASPGEEAFERYFAWRVSDPDK